MSTTAAASTALLPANHIGSDLSLPGDILTSTVHAIDNSIQHPSKPSGPSENDFPPHRPSGSSTTDSPAERSADNTPVSGSLSSPMRDEQASADGEHDAVSPPPKHIGDVSDEDSSSDVPTRRSQKRALVLDEEDEIEKNPELYGLRRSVRWSSIASTYSRFVLTRRSTGACSNHSSNGNLFYQDE